jgi:hypothetical protein
VADGARAPAAAYAGARLRWGSRVLVVHGLWRSAGRLALWAEDSTLPAEPPRRRGRSPRTAAHPFAATSEVLTDALTEALGVLGAPFKPATTDSAPLLLPTAGRGPLPSPELVREDLTGAPTGPVALGAWRVPTIEYDPDEALGILCTLGDADITVGATVRHLVTVAGFAADLVARGRLLPTVEPGPVAAWRPVLAGPDAAWAQALALALPPASRAEAEQTTLAPILDALVDAAARAALSGYPIRK